MGTRDDDARTSAGRANRIRRRPEPLGIDGSERVYRLLLLLLFPPRFRRDHGDEATRLFRDRYRDEARRRGIRGIAAYWLRTFCNVALHGPLEFVSAARRRTGMVRRSALSSRGTTSTFSPHTSLCNAGPGMASGKRPTTSGAPGNFSTAGVPPPGPRRDRPGRGIAADVLYGIRVLRRSPGFTAAAVGALAFGIGANTAIFSLVNGILLNPLPYADPDSLVMVFQRPPVREVVVNAPASPAVYLEWRESSGDVFSDIAVLHNESRGFTRLEQPLVPLTHAVSANYFGVLGVEPMLGRTFVPDEEAAGGARVVIVSHAIWQAALGGDPEVVGRQVELDEEVYTVIGVMPPDFYSSHVFPTQPDLWVLLDLEGREQDRSDRTFAVYARLRPGVGVERAEAGMAAIQERIAAEFPETNEGWGAAVVPIYDNIVGRYRQTFGWLLAAVGFILLIACANVANLIFARATERSREVSLRLALGARRGRLARQLLIESVLLGALGGLVAAAVAFWSVEALAAMIPAGAQVPFVDKVTVDTTVLAFTVILSLLTGVACGVLPALQASNTDLVTALKSEGRGEASGRHGRRLRGALVVFEFALSLILLTGAGLALQSFYRLSGFEAGYESERVLALRNSLRGDAYASPEGWIEHFSELQRRLGTLPDVESVSGVSFPPPIQPFGGIFFGVPGDDSTGQGPAASGRQVLPGYFRTLGIELLEGRVFDDRDDAGGAPVAIVNQVLAERFLAGQDLASMRIVASDERVERQVVGIVGNVRTLGAQPDPVPVVYRPMAQRPTPIMTMVIRTRGEPVLLGPIAEKEAWGLGTTTNVYQIETLEERLSNSMWQPRLAMQLLAGFAVLAVLLGGAGIYSVMTYSVSRRVPEIGIRVALGAGRRKVIGMVLTEGLRLSLAGAALGVAGAVALGRVAAGVVYGVSATEPLTLVLVTTMMLIVGVAACLQPALRATRVDPIEALRSR